MKFGPVIKPDRRSTTRSKKLTMTSCQQIATSSTSFLFMADSEQFLVLTFSLKATFYLTKTENITKLPLAQLSYYCFE